VNRHVLTDKNTVALTAICSMCGLVDIARRQSRGKEYYICRKKMNTDRVASYKRSKNIRHYVSDVVDKVGNCSVCGPNTKTNIRGNCLNKINETNQVRYNSGLSVVKMKDGFTYTSKDKQDLYMAQHGKCAICGIRFVSVNAGCVDHNHLTIKMRELLCDACNKMLGHARDNVNILRAAIRYLEKHAQETAS
jgi:hypothetical protein